MESSNGGAKNRITRRRVLVTGAGMAASVTLGLLGSGGCVRRDSASDSSGGKTRIRFWNGFTGPDGKTMEAIVRQFQKDNPDIAVAMQIIPWSTYYDKLTLSLAYGGAPELFVVHAARLPEYASFGVLQPLGELFRQSGGAIGQRDFAPVPWKATFFDGAQYAFPLDVHPIGLYYNRGLFEKAGIVDAQGRARPPRTWDEFLDAAKRLTRDTDNDGSIDQWGFVFTNQRTNFLTFLGQFGGTVLTPDGKQCTLDTPEAIAAAEHMHSLIYDHKIAPKPEGVDPWLAFRQGKAAMAMEGIYMLASLEEQKGLPYAGAPAPQFGPEPAAWGGSHLLAMPNPLRGIRPTDAQMQASWRLMRYLSDHSLEWGKGGQVPARTEVVQSPEFAALPVQSQFARQLPYVVYEPLIPRMNAIFPFIDPAVEAILNNSETPENAFEDAARRVNQVLERA